MITPVESCIPRITVAMTAPSSNNKATPTTAAIARLFVSLFR